MITQLEDQIDDREIKPHFSPRKQVKKKLTAEDIKEQAILDIHQFYAR